MSYNEDGPIVTYMEGSARDKDTPFSTLPCFGIDNVGVCNVAVHATLCTNQVCHELREREKNTGNELEMNWTNEEPSQS